MGVSFLIFLGIIWGIFGVWGFLRGWKAGLLMTALIVGTLVLLSLAPAQIQKFFGYVNSAAELMTNSKKPLVNTAPSSLVVILLPAAVVIGFLLSLLRVFRIKPSFLGFLLGFSSGYLFTAYLLAALVPQRAILPLPIKIQGLKSVALASAAAAPPSTGLIGTFLDWIEKALKMSCLPTAIVGAIILFILLTVLVGNKGSRKG